MRCGACGASNPETARWCGQCLAPIVTPSPEPGEPDARPTAGDEPPARTPGASSEGFRRAGDTLEWACPACGEWTPIEVLECRVCATPLSARWLRAERPQPADTRFGEPWAVAFLLSVVVPGAGHIGLRRYGTGVGRAVLYAVWLAGGVGLLAAGGRQAAMAAAPLLAGALLLWGASLADLQALRAGRRELLAGRVLLWLVVAVIGLSVVGIFAAAV